MAYEDISAIASRQKAVWAGPSIDLEGLDVASASEATMLDFLAERVVTRERLRISFMNAHCFNVARRDPYYRSALQRMDLLLPDGSGIMTAAKLKKQRFEANLNGTDFIPALFDHLSATPPKVFFLGGKPGVAEEAAEKMLRAHPHITVAGCRDGYFQPWEAPEVIQEINASKADIVLVAMGVPLQELFIDRHRFSLTAPLVFGVGGLFDFMAERVSRAPEVLRASGMEWTWRLLQEPGRMWRRYVLGNPVYLAHAGLDAFRTRLKRRHDIIARALDIAAASAGLIAASPILLGAMVAVKATSPGPALFRQTRIGRDGRPFTLLKLRTMRSDAEAVREKLEAENHHGADAITFKMADDPRVTAVGRFLRRYSLDELPQLWNVLRGDMAVVGPRPPLPTEVIRYEGQAWGRLAVKPGLTCLWQIGGRAKLAFAEQVKLDLQYIASRDLITDLAIIFKTPSAVLKGEGAC